MDCSQDFGFFSPINDLQVLAKLLKPVEMRSQSVAGIRIAKLRAKRFITTVKFRNFTCRKEQGIGQEKGNSPAALSQHQERTANNEECFKVVYDPVHRIGQYGSVCAGPTNKR